MYIDMDKGPRLDEIVNEKCEDGITVRECIQNIVADAFGIGKADPTRHWRLKMCVAESRDITYKGYIMAEETSKPDQFTQNAHVVFPNLCISQERKCMLKNYVKI